MLVQDLLNVRFQIAYQKNIGKRKKASKTSDQLTSLRNEMRRDNSDNYKALQPTGKT